MLGNMPVIPVLLIAVSGLAILLVSGAYTIRGAVDMARCLGVSPLIIGMTVVAFGTSTPELVVSLQALWKGTPDIVFGNVLGSNIANILLIVGVAAAIKTLIVPGGTKLRQDYMLLLVFTAIYVALSYVSLRYLGKISGLLGLLMVVGLVGYTIHSFRSSRKEGQLSGVVPESTEKDSEEILPLGRAVLFTLGGIFCITLGSFGLLEGSVELARRLEISEVVIGLTIIAIGTSLPELAASVMAAVRGHPGLAIGNVMGSNLFNMFGITGVSAGVSEVFFESLQVPEQVVRLDLWVMFGATVLICIILLRGWRIVRLGGVAMLTLYLLYIAVLFSKTSFALPG